MFTDTTKGEFCGRLKSHSNVLGECSSNANGFDECATHLDSSVINTMPSITNVPILQAGIFFQNIKCMQSPYRRGGRDVVAYWGFKRAPVLYKRRG